MAFTRTVSLPSNYKDMSYMELQKVWRDMARAGGLSAFGKETPMAQTLRDQMKVAYEREKAAKKKSAAPAATTSAPAGSGTPQSVAQPFERALAALSGVDSDVEKMYQTGKRRTMSNIAMQHVQSGMANVLNMPAAELAYEQAVRPGTNVGVAQAKAGVLQNLGQVASNVYGTQVGAETARYGTDVSAAASRYAADRGAAVAEAGQAMQFHSNLANQSLQRYIADLNAPSQQMNTSPVPILGAPRIV